LDGTGEWVLIPSGGQAGLDGVVGDVFYDDLEIAIGSDNAVVEILLPSKPGLLPVEPVSGVLFKGTDGFPGVGLGAEAQKDQVQVIRHEAVNGHRALLPVGCLLQKPDARSDHVRR
jgi:hypothetical protein